MVIVVLTFLVHMSSPTPVCVFPVSSGSCHCDQNTLQGLSLKICGASLPLIFESSMLSRCAK